MSDTPNNDRKPETPEAPAGKGDAFVSTNDVSRYEDHTCKLITSKKTAPALLICHNTVSNYSKLHSMMLLSDSALPLGAFAFSSGLESVLAHKPTFPKAQLLNIFITHSLASVARSALPYLISAHINPSTLSQLDNDFDACTPCTVARRASIAQGRALLTIWERSYRLAAPRSAAANALRELSSDMKESTAELEDTFEVCAHLAPVFGVVAAAFGLDSLTSAHIFLMSHVKAVLSAAVRAGIVGPFQAQALLTSSWIRDAIEAQVKANEGQRLLQAGQVWVPGDIWLGRHELLYSRIFNS